MKTLRLAAIAQLAALAMASTAVAQHCGTAYNSGDCNGGCNAGCSQGCNGGFDGAVGYGPCGGRACGRGPAGPHNYTLQDAYCDSRIWPRQYIGPSRRGICQAFAIQANNGWRMANLLGKFHFDQEGMELSEAGRLKVQWILTQAPLHRRTIFVERGIDASQTAERVAAVQELAANVAAGPVDVQETYVHDEGRPAGGVDAIFTGFRANQMPPVLPQASGGSGSSESSEQ